MWELYADDESFQRMARGRGVHDAKLLAKVLYGNKVVKRNKNEIKEATKVESDKNNKNNKQIKFQEGEGRFVIDSSLLSEDEDGEGTEFMA